ncbi:hypothetical protein Taro_048504, partial [Colocasia esculenta]|nr:hypothetical protein [Colocasia esculenta]
RIQAGSSSAIATAGGFHQQPRAGGGGRLKLYPELSAMAAKALTTEAIALTEKKVDMSLDDIIKMSKKNVQKGNRPPRVSNKSQGFQKVVAAQRNSSKVQRFMDSRSSVRQGVLARRRTNFRVNQFPLTTEVARKAVVAPSRNRVANWNKPSNELLPGAELQLQLSRGMSKAHIMGSRHLSSSDKAVGLKFVDGMVVFCACNVQESAMKPRPQTLDARFASMKQQRMRVMNQQMVRGTRSVNPQRRRGQQQPQRGRGGGFPVGAGRRLGNF